MRQRMSQNLCKLFLIFFGYFFHKIFWFWKKSRYENSMWVADIRMTNSRRSSSAPHFGFSNRDFFENWKFSWKCDPKLIKGSLHNFSGLLHCVISQGLWFENQKLFFALLPYRHTTLFKWLSTSDLFCPILDGQQGGGQWISRSLPTQPELDNTLLDSQNWARGG